MELSIYINKDLAKVRLARTKLLNRKKEIESQLEICVKERAEVDKKKDNIQSLLNDCNGRAAVVNEKIKENCERIENLSKKIIQI